MTVLVLSHVEHVLRRSFAGLLCLCLALRRRKLYGIVLRVGEKLSWIVEKKEPKKAAVHIDTDHAAAHDNAQIIVGQQQLPHTTEAEVAEAAEAVEVPEAAEAAAAAAEAEGAGAGVGTSLYADAAYAAEVAAEADAAYAAEVAYAAEAAEMAAAAIAAEEAAAEAAVAADAAYAVEVANRQSYE